MGLLGHKLLSKAGQRFSKLGCSEAQVTRASVVPPGGMGAGPAGEKGKVRTPASSTGQLYFCFIYELL